MLWRLLHLTNPNGLTNVYSGEASPFSLSSPNKSIFTVNPVCLTPIHVLGILASIYRISRRWKTRQSGLDDYAATLALILDLFFFPTLWLRNGDAAQEVPSVGLSTTVAGGGLLGDNLPADIETRIAQVVIGWLVQVVYPLLTW